MSDEKEKLPERLYIEYICFDVNRSEKPSSLSRLQYVTSLDEERTQYYWGTSFGCTIEKEDLEDMVSKGKLIKLETLFVLEWGNDLWLKTDGTIVSALGYAPWDTKEPTVVGKMIQSLKEESNDV